MKMELSSANRFLALIRLDSGGFRTEEVTNIIEDEEPARPQEEWLAKIREQEIRAELAEAEIEHLKKALADSEHRASLDRVIAETSLAEIESKKALAEVTAPAEKAAEKKKVKSLLDRAGESK